jgi:hypothetical protein
MLKFQFIDRTLLFHFTHGCHFKLFTGLNLSLGQIPLFKSVDKKNFGTII